MKNTWENTAKLQQEPCNKQVKTLICAPQKMEDVKNKTNMPATVSTQMWFLRWDITQNN